MRRLRFLRQVHHFRSRELHAGREVISRDTGLQIAVARILLGVTSIEEFKKLARGDFIVLRDAVRPREIAHRLMSGHHDPLMPCREKSVRPVGLAVGRLAPCIGNCDEGGKVVVFAAEGVAGPGTCGGEALGRMPGIHKDAAGTMRIGSRHHRMHEGHVIDMLRNMRQHRREPLPRLATGNEGPGAGHQVAVLALERDQVFLPRERLPRQPFEFGFVIPEVEMRGCSGTEDLQHPLGLRCVMRHPPAGLPVRGGGAIIESEAVLSQQVRQPNPGHRGRDMAEEVPSIQCRAGSTEHGIKSQKTELEWFPVISVSAAHV